MLQSDCKKCYACCEYIGIPTPYESSDVNMREFYEARGFTVRAVAGKLLMEIKLPCPYLEYIDIDEARCSVYPQRPELCRVYDCGLHVAPSKMLKKLVMKGVPSED